MVSIEEQFIYDFEAGKNYSENFFHTLLKSTLNYKYRHHNNNFVSISKEDLSDAIFRLSSKDSITLFNKNVNGQKIKELFITSIYLNCLDMDVANTGKFIFISIPFVEESYDVAIYITDKGVSQYIRNGNKCRLPDNYTGYHIQIKEEFNHDDYKNDYKTLKKGLNIKSLEKKSLGYDELVLIFMRDYRKYNTIEAKPFLMKNKNIGLICMPSLEPKDAPNGIILDKDKYNFFLYNEDKIIHIKFNQSHFLIPKNS